MFLSSSPDAALMLLAWHLRLTACQPRRTFSPWSPTFPSASASCGWLGCQGKTRATGMLQGLCWSRGGLKSSSFPPPAGGSGSPQWRLWIIEDFLLRRLLADVCAFLNLPHAVHILQRRQLVVRVKAWKLPKQKYSARVLPPVSRDISRDDSTEGTPDPNGS